jgi:CubicO group peptidase (beta-lactamase class C family)
MSGSARGPRPGSGRRRSPATPGDLVATAAGVSRFAAIATVAVMATNAPGLAQVAAPAAPLTGVWTAERTFGPTVAGPIALMEAGGSYVAEAGGYRMAARIEDDRVRFSAPGDRGYFRGRLDADGAVRGHWVQPSTRVSFAPMASPVTLTRAGAGRWEGVIVPLPDRLRFYLTLRETEDGRIAGFLRNPEANLGRFYPIADVARSGAGIRLLDAQGRERLRGSYDADADRLSIAFPLNGGAFDFQRADSASFFWPRPLGEEPYRYRTPPDGDGWQGASAAAVGMDATMLEGLVRVIVATPMDAIDAPAIHAVLVARHGKLVLEEYFHGYVRDDRHATRSASKTVTATLVGAAEHAGQLTRDADAYRAFARGDPSRGVERRELALRHLITHTSGLACDDRDPSSPGNEDVMQQQDSVRDWLAYTLDLPVLHAPGEHGAYCSAGMHLAGGVLARLSGSWLPDLFREQLAEPLAMGPYHMNLTPAGEGYGGGGLYVRARDFLKLGQLYLDQGVRDGRRVFDPGWVSAATSPAVRLGEEEYGFGWWLLTYPSSRGPASAYYAGGNGGQYLIVVPSLDLTVVIFGGNFNQAVQHRSKYEYVRDYVIAAVRDGP